MYGNVAYSTRKHGIHLRTVLQNPEHRGCARAATALIKAQIATECTARVFQDLLRFCGQATCDSVLRSASTAVSLTERQAHTDKTDRHTDMSFLRLSQNTNIVLLRVVAHLCSFVFCVNRYGRCFTVPLRDADTCASRSRLFYHDRWTAF